MENIQNNPPFWGFSVDLQQNMATCRLVVVWNSENVQINFNERRLATNPLTYEFWFQAQEKETTKFRSLPARHGTVCCSTADFLKQSIRKWSSQICKGSRQVKNLQSQSLIKLLVNILKKLPFFKFKRAQTFFWTFPWLEGLRPNSHRTRHKAHANWNIFPLMLLVCSVNTPINDNRSHLLVLRCASRPASCVN